LLMRPASPPRRGTKKATERKAGLLFRFSFFREGAQAVAGASYFE